MTNKSGWGVFHKHIHIKIKEKQPNKKTIGWKELIVCLNRHTIPKEHCIKFIKEMERLKLLKKINKKKIRLL